MPSQTSHSLRGTYVLRIQVQRRIAVRFGRFRGGAPVAVPAGECLYVGSALGQHGSSTLRNRLLRHARRSAGTAVHPIYAALRAHFGEAGEDVGPSATSKHLWWHIDYLLEEPWVDLVAIYVVPALVRLEREVAAWLAADCATFAIAPGLGASDATGTHLLGVAAGADWWLTLPRRIQQALALDTCITLGPVLPPHATDGDPSPS